jgi:hypothetical protein
MKRILSITIILSCSLSSCLSTSQSSQPTTGPSQAAIAAENATATETSVPTAAVTPTLSPENITYEFSEDVTERDRELLREMVRLGRYYMINHLGSDLTIPARLILDNNPEGRSATLVGGKGYFSSDYFCGTASYPCFQYNAASAVWQECSNEDFLFKCLHSHELFHMWQLEHGCGGLWGAEADPLTGFIYEGMAEYMGFLATGFPEDAEDFSDGYAFSFWPAEQFNETAWFRNGAVAAVAVRRLVDEHGPLAFARFCDSEGQGASPQSAFRSAFGMTVEEFRARFMEEVLGQTRDCTMATCGSGSALIGQFNLQDFLAPGATTPNLVARFVGENGSPLVISNILLARLRIDVPNDNRQIDEGVPGIFSAALLPGRYAFYFCESGYPGTEPTAACRGHETEWFEVSEDQVTSVTFRIPPDIEEPARTDPNLIMEILDENGLPVPGLRLQVCNYDAPVKVCSPALHGKQTDANGIYQDSLRSGKYVVRFNWPGVGYAREWTYVFEVDNVNIGADQPTRITYQLPQPNLLVELTDLAGAPAAAHFLYLCRVDDQLGNCDIANHSPNPWSWGSYTNDQGVFKAVVAPGVYFILTSRFPTFVTLPTDYVISDINVSTEPETTTVEYQLK